MFLFYLRKLTQDQRQDLSFPHKREIGPEKDQNFFHQIGKIDSEKDQNIRVFSN